MVMRLFNVHLSYKKRESESWIILSPGVYLIRTRIRTHSLRRQTSSPTCTSINTRERKEIRSYLLYHVWLERLQHVVPTGTFDY